MNTNVVNLQNATALGQAQATQQAQKDGVKPDQALGKDAFLRLLMTQLQAQDPMNPADSTEFVTQLSQFTSLESLQNLGKKMDDLVMISGASNSANAVSLLGKDVRVAGNQLKGPTSAYYELERAASNVKLEVRDKDGKIVKVWENLPTAVGLQTVKLEGIPQGDYTFRVEAKDKLGTEVKSALSVAERVRGVNFAGNVPMLLMESGTQMRASDLVEIHQPVVATPSSSAGDS